MAQHISYDIVEIKKHFGKNLKEIRKSRNLTQEAFADLLGKSTSLISQYESGKKNPTLCSALEMANILQIPIEELCKMDDLTGLHIFESYIPPITSVLLSLKSLKADVHINEERREITLSLSEKNDCLDYSTIEILSFFKEYAIIQDLYNNSSATSDMINLLIENLRKNYRNFPHLPDYNDYQKRTSNKD